MSNEASTCARPEELPLWFNGLDGRRGSCLLPPVPARPLGDPALRVAAPPGKEAPREN